jgi:hypothetical protein
VDENVTILEQQTRSTGFGGAGSVFIAWKGASNDVFTQLDEYVFSYSGDGAITIEWTGKIEWQRNAATHVKFFVCLDQTPTYSGGFYSNFQGDIVIYQGNQNALSTNAILPINLEGLSVGSHTLSIWAQTEENTANIPYVDVGATFKEFTGKK